MHQSPKGAYRQLPLCLVGDFTLCEVDPPYTVPQLMLVGIAPPARHAYQANFDYNKFWAEVTEGRELVSAIAYATGSEVYGVPALTSDLLTREADRFVPIDQRLLLK